MPGLLKDLTRQSADSLAIGTAISMCVSGKLSMSTDDITNILVGTIGSELVQQTVTSAITGEEIHLTSKISAKSLKSIVTGVTKVGMKQATEVSAQTVAKISGRLVSKVSDMVGRQAARMTTEAVSAGVTAARTGVKMTTKLGAMLSKEAVEFVAKMTLSGGVEAAFVLFDVGNLLLDLFDPFSFGIVLNNSELLANRFDIIQQLQDVYAKVPVQVDGTTYTGANLPAQYGGPLRYPLELHPNYPEFDADQNLVDPEILEFMVQKQFEYLDLNGYRIAPDPAKNDPMVTLTAEEMTWPLPSQTKGAAAFTQDPVVIATITVMAMTSLYLYFG